MSKDKISKNADSSNGLYTLLCDGLFVRKDINGNDVKVGDIVKVTRPEFEFESYNEEYVVIEEESWIGQVRMLMSKGIVVKTKDSGYIKAPLTNKSRNVWKWELVKACT